MTVLCSFNEWLLMKKQFFILTIINVFILFSCKSGTNKVFTTSATGRPGDVLLVMTNDTYNSSAGIAISQALQTSVPSLPQDEPMFKLSFVNPSGLIGNLKTVRNIFIVDVDSTRFTQTSLTYAYDEWAEGQMVLNVTSPSIDSLSSYIERNKAPILDMMVRHEFFITMTYLASHYSDLANKYVDSIFGYRINMPMDINKHKFGKDFIWMSNDAIRKRMDFMVYSIPYNNKKSIELDNIVRVRDSVLKVNIQGESENSYPTTEKKVMLLYRKIQMPNKEIRGEVRGLWRMEGPDMMGGPFVCQAFIDESKNRVVFVDAFVYNPNDKKRTLMRTMEAALYSIRVDSIVNLQPKTILDTKFSKLY